MQQCDELKFATLMAMLSEVFDDGRPVSTAKMEIYFHTLTTFDIDEVEKGIKGLIVSRTTASFPKPAEILQEIQGMISNRATLAWIDVLYAVKRIGHYQSVQFSDPIIHSVIQVMGGWISLAGDMTAGEEKWKQKEFERLYAVISENPKGKHPEYLAGLCETDNNAKGYKIETPIVKIGFERLEIVKCQPQPTLQ